MHSGSNHNIKCTCTTGRCLVLGQHINANTLVQNSWLFVLMLNITTPTTTTTTVIIPIVIINIVLVIIIRCTDAISSTDERLSEVFLWQIPFLLWRDELFVCYLYFGGPVPFRFLSFPLFPASFAFWKITHLPLISSKIIFFENVLIAFSFFYYIVGLFFSVVLMELRPSTTMTVQDLDCLGILVSH
jgi:hypothetical protein